ncbi:hypothetical protein [Leisingera sp. ANG-M7]|nr:hypothetical protein [Leisingera sp. ANG-M7]
MTAEISAASNSAPVWACYTHSKLSETAYQQILKEKMAIPEGLEPSTC